MTTFTKAELSQQKKGFAWLGSNPVRVTSSGIQHGMCYHLDTFICHIDQGSGYEGRFTKCGICTLMKELGLYDLTPAMCHLDYTMSEAGGVTNFVRQYTLASGGPYCDCGYQKKRV